MSILTHFNELQELADPDLSEAPAQCWTCGAWIADGEGCERDLGAYELGEGQRVLSHLVYLCGRCSGGVE